MSFGIERFFPIFVEARDLRENEVATREEMSPNGETKSISGKSVTKA